MSMQWLCHSVHIRGEYLRKALNNIKRLPGNKPAGIALKRKIFKRRGPVQKRYAVHGYAAAVFILPGAGKYMHVMSGMGQPAGKVHRIALGTAAQVVIFFSDEGDFHTNYCIDG
jgi:hypothetical protein